MSLDLDLDLDLDLELDLDLHLDLELDLDLHLHSGLDGLGVHSFTQSPLVELFLTVGLVKFSLVYALNKLQNTAA